MPVNIRNLNEKGMEIMKKFMKFCFVLALVLIIVGGVFYMLGRKSGGRNEMEELLSDIGGDWVDIDDLLLDGWGSSSYDIDDASIFSDDYAVWKGDVEKQMLCQGGIDELNLEIGGSMVEIKKSSDENIYIEGKSVGKMQAYVDDGVLYIKAVRPANLMDEIKNSTITLYLPRENGSLMMLDVSLGAGQLKLANLTVQNMEASIGAGQLLMEDMTLSSLDVSLGAGELRTKDVTVETLAASIGAGNMDFSGGIGSSAQITCSMGNVSMELEGEKEDFNYQLNCVAGNMKIDGDSYAGASVDQYIDNGAAKYMEIDCSMGNVEVDF